ncbi:hypothetical protein ACLB2K_067689 [Fragaria x ananassa]
MLPPHLDARFLLAFANLTAQFLLALVPDFSSPRSSAGKIIPPGQLFVDQFNEKHQFGFVDYIFSGFELNFMAVVDFTATEIAGNSLFHGNNKYYVLLIITILTNLQETTDALVRASDLPLSILIVGVGRTDFKQMEIFDADNGQRLSSSTEHEGTALSKNNCPPPIAKAKGKGKSVATGIVIDD